MKTSTSCIADKYGSFDNIRDAKEACTVDPNCAAIYDNYCDTSYVELCPRGFTEQQSSPSGSCLFMKPRKESPEVFMIFFYVCAFSSA